MAPVLELEAIRVDGRRAPRLDGVSLQLRQGETVGVVGESGSRGSQSPLMPRTIHRFRHGEKCD